MKDIKKERRKSKHCDKLDHVKPNLYQLTGKIKIRICYRMNWAYGMEFVVRFSLSPIRLVISEATL